MHSSKKFISHIFSVGFFCLFIIVPNSAMGLVFDRVAAKVNSEIITLSSVEEKLEVLRQKYKNNRTSIDEKKLLKDVVEMMVAEKLQFVEYLKR